MLLLALFTKHLIVDFFLQRPYHYLNKGTYGHFGGIEHAILHAIGTLIVLAPFTHWCWALALLDGVIHYHVDWAKMNINKHFGWGPLTSEKYWWLLGLDQYAHTLTYLLIVALV